MQRGGVYRIDVREDNGHSLQSLTRYAAWWRTGFMFSALTLLTSVYTLGRGAQLASHRKHNV